MTKLQFDGLVAIKEVRQITKKDDKTAVIARVMTGSTEDGISVEFRLNEEQFRLVDGKEGTYAMVVGNIQANWKKEPEFNVHQVRTLTKTEALEMQLQNAKKAEASATKAA